MEWPATTMTAASGGIRELLLGPRPAKRKRKRSGCWEPQLVLVSEEKAPQTDETAQTKRAAPGGVQLSKMRGELVGDALSHHGGSNFQETSAVCAHHQVALGTSGNRSVIAGMEDPLHDALELCIDFFKGPAQSF